MIDLKKFLVFPAVLMISCGQAVPERGGPPCPGNTAAIQVFDGYYVSLCGCSNLGGGTASTNLRCEVPVGTEVFFLFNAARGTRAIHSVGPNLFPESPVYDGLGRFVGSPPGYAVKVESLGDYGFEDAFFPDMKGVIVGQ